eukprot:TRINITY_DN4253_c0_g1_i1.p1 TRINITY_DN4253_c0_g1~~TRINITY_DN4253_c0_g1_i1.p1  ORF type:complete len:510 (-),score=179.60 TRINITY_DN4253_c0_g1_i1:18-1547(-)
MIENEKQKSLCLLAHKISSIISLITNQKETIYAMGPFSNFIAKEIDFINPLRAHNDDSENLISSDTPLSLIIIDRVLDLVTPLLHSECLLDCIFNCHTKQINTRSCLDIKIPINYAIKQNSNLIVNKNRNKTKTKTKTKTNSIEINNVFGSIAHPKDENCSILLEKLSSIKLKDTLLELRKQALEIAKKNNIVVANSIKIGNVTIEKIKAIIDCFLQTDNFDCKMWTISAMQILCSALIALESMTSSNWQSQVATEKILLLSADEMGQLDITLIKQMIDSMIQQKTEILDLLKFLILAYSLLGFGGENQTNLFLDCLNYIENQIFDYFSEKLLNNKESDKNKITDWLKLTQKIDDNSNDNLDNLKLKVKEYCSILQEIALARRNLNQYRQLRSLIEYNQSHSLLSRILFEIADGTIDMTDLQQITKVNETVLSNLFWSGFSLLRNSNAKQIQQKPAKNGLLFIFVVGGISFSEVCELKQIAKNNQLQILIGSDSICNTNQILKDLLHNN